MSHASSITAGKIPQPAAQKDSEATPKGLPHLFHLIPNLLCWYLLNKFV
jgi:hypothetical protein